MTGLKCLVQQFLTPFPVSIKREMESNVGQFEGSRSPDWVDFVGGFRGQQYLSDALYIEGTALAGFGGSDFMWDVYGGLGYNFTPNFSGSIGYRGLGVNYNTGAAELDLTMHGPVAGLTLRF